MTLVNASDHALFRDVKPPNEAMPNSSISAATMKNAERAAIFGPEADKFLRHTRHTHLGHSARFLHRWGPTHSAELFGFVSGSAAR